MSTPHVSHEDPYSELREGVRAVCSTFDSAYWQQVDEARGYPEAFVEALTKAGWLSALITTPKADTSTARSPTNRA